MDQKQKNIEAISNEIFLKNRSTPYIVGNSIYNLNNEMDHFPYSKWFISIPTEDIPRVKDREAGWQPKNKEFFKTDDIIKKEKLKAPNLCFQGPTSIVYPCYVQDTSYIGINKACVSEYR